MRRALPAFVRAASRFACGVAFGLVVAIILIGIYVAITGRRGTGAPRTR